MNIPKLMKCHGFNKGDRHNGPFLTQGDKCLHDYIIGRKIQKKLKETLLELEKTHKKIKQNIYN